MQLRFFFLIITILILSFLSDRQHQVLTKAIGNTVEANIRKFKFPDPSKSLSAPRMAFRPFSMPYGKSLLDLKKAQSN